MKSAFDPREPRGSRFANRTDAHLGESMSEFMAIARPFSLAILILFGAGTSPSAFAETRVSGAGDAVRLEAQNATLGEALAALGAGLAPRYRNSTPLNRRVSGVYVGSLEHVVSRLLRGSDFIIKKSAEGVEVVLIVDSAIGQRQNSPRPGLPSPPPGQPRPPWLR